MERRKTGREVMSGTMSGGIATRITIDGMGFLPVRTTAIRALGVQTAGSLDLAGMAVHAGKRRATFPTLERTPAHLNEDRTVRQLHPDIGTSDLYLALALPHLLARVLFAPHLHLALL